MRTAFVTALTTCENYGDPIYVIDSSETVIDYEVALTKSVAYSTDLKSMPTNPGGTAPFANYLMNADGTLTPIQGSNVNAINTTKTTATYGISNDVFVKVYLLSGVSPANVTSVALADGTVLPYNTTDGAYEKDVQYTSAVPTSANIVLTTANGTQTYTVLAQ
ncbi:hypothetical protein SBF1_4580001 [Candidatus Desulfosporosinus infrequens]|uniref:Uncharacterized protein n=1 Tax=Candidatus Desulfosporosinus infrequens TaxID=2043169 RepID=A0A2U3LCD4_9FIRM|nr:hypothetical protein SBF1_4580001 [Candidatus Desulfosporosinus infrequens]